MLISDGRKLHKVVQIRFATWYEGEMETGKIHIRVPFLATSAVVLCINVFLLATVNFF